MNTRWKVLTVLFLSSLGSNAFPASLKLALDPVDKITAQSAPIVIQISPPAADFQVRPSIGGQVITIDIDVFCSFFGAPIPDCQITNNTPVPAEPNTGGHIHSDDGRPLGTVDPLQGNSGSDGILTVTYTAPEASGVVRLSGSGFHPNFGFFSGNFTVGVMISGLEALGASTNYDLVGQTTTHPSNHSGTGSFLSSLRKLAQAYVTANPGQRLAYNDISLAYGGLFDFGAGWSAPHVSHRLGTDVDLRLVPPKKRLALQQMVYTAGISTILIEGSRNHWHLRQ